DNAPAEVVAEEAAAEPAERHSRIEPAPAAAEKDSVESAEAAEAEGDARDEIRGPAVAGPEKATEAEAREVVELPETVGTEAAPAKTAQTAFPAGDDRRKATDTAILERLPVPVLVHSGDTLHYANDEFFK